MTPELEQMQRMLQRLTNAGADEAAERMAKFTEVLNTISGALADLVTAVEAKPAEREQEDIGPKLVQAIKALKLPAASVTVEAPIVTVEPKINVQSPEVRVEVRPEAPVVHVQAPTVNFTPAEQAKTIDVAFHYEGDRIAGATITRK